LDGSQPKERAMFGFLPRICCSGFVVVAVLILGSLLLRAAIALANKLLGTSGGRQYYPDDKELDEWIGYRQIKRKSPSAGVPALGLGKGMTCVFLLAIFGFLPGILIRFFFERDSGYFNDDLALVAHLFGLIIGFPISALVLAGMLPTKFGRACLVLLLSYLIIIAFVGGTYAVLYIVVLGLR
jgi:hypothetical protein